MSRTGVVLLFLVVACKGDGGGGPVDGIRAGDRLRPVFLQADGVRQFVAWYDSARDARCGFQRVGDGVYRCVPELATPSYFEDAGCTEPLIERFTGECDGELPGHIGEYGAGCGGALVGLYERGAEVTPDAVYLLDGSTGECIGLPPTDGAIYFRRGAAIPLGDFVAATEQLEELPGRIERISLHADDGATSSHGLHDSELDAECWGFAQADVTHFIPLGSYLGPFADLECATPLAERYTCGDEDPAPYAVDFVSGECGYEVHVFPQGEPWTEEPVYSESGDACVEYVPGTDAELFAVGAEIPLAQLASATRVIAEGDSRLRHYRLENDEGVVLPRYGFYDSELGAACDAYTTEEGVRCVPYSAEVYSAFADADCTVALDYAAQSLRPCDPPPPAPTTAVRWVSDGTCSGHLELHAVADELAEGEIYFGAPGACTVYTWNVETTRVYRIGDPVPVTDLVELTEVTY
jgi:hypothetical protein